MSVFDANWIEPAKICPSRMWPLALMLAVQGVRMTAFRPLPKFVLDCIVKLPMGQAVVG